MILIKSHTALYGTKVELNARRVEITEFRATDDKPQLVTTKMSLADVWECAQSDNFTEGFSSCRNKVIVGAFGLIATAIDKCERTEKVLDESDVPCQYFEMYFGPHEGPEHMTCTECGAEPKSRL